MLEIMQTIQVLVQPDYWSDGPATLSSDYESDNAILWYYRLLLFLIEPWIAYLFNTIQDNDGLDSQEGGRKEDLVE